MTKKGRKYLGFLANKVSGQDYSAERLRVLFSSFGEVGDVVIKKVKKKRGLELVAMAAKDAAVSLLF